MSGAGRCIAIVVTTSIFFVACPRSTAAPPGGGPDQTRPAADERVEALLTAIDQAAHDLKTLSADVTVVTRTQNGAGGPPRTDRQTGLVRMAAPNRLRVEMDQSVRLCDGTSAWIFDQRKGDCAKYPQRGWDKVVATGMPSFFATNLQLLAQEVAAPIHFAGERKVDGESYQVLEAEGKAGARRWFVGSDHLIHRAQSVLLLPYGRHDEIEVSYANLRLNAPLKEELFRYDAPAGVRVVEYADGFDHNDMKLAPGAQAPDLVLPTADGQTVRLSDVWKGHRLTILYIWNTSCGACHTTLPVLEALRREYGDRGLGVLVIHEGYSPGGYPGLDHDSPAYRGEGGQERYTRDELQRYAKDYEFHFVQPMLETAESLKPYWSDSYPSVYFVDGQGTIVARTHAHNPYLFQDELAKAGLVAAQPKPQAGANAKKG